MPEIARWRGKDGEMEVKYSIPKERKGPGPNSGRRFVFVFCPLPTTSIKYCPEWITSQLLASSCFKPSLLESQDVFRLQFLLHPPARGDYRHNSSFSPPTGIARISFHCSTGFIRHAWSSPARCWGCLLLGILLTSLTVLGHCTQLGCCVGFLVHRNEYQHGLAACRGQKPAWLSPSHTTPFLSVLSRRRQFTFI